MGTPAPRPEWRKESWSTPGDQVPIDSTQKKKKDSGWLMLFTLGAITALLGLAAILIPFVASLAISFVIGGVLAAHGVFQMIFAFQSRHYGGFWWKFLFALAALAAGAVIIAFPMIALVTLTVLLGTILLLEGVLKTKLAFELRPHGNWKWTMFSGLVSGVLALVIWFGLPSTAAYVLGLLVGIHLFVNGWSIMVFSLYVRKALQARL